VNTVPSLTLTNFYHRPLVAAAELHLSPPDWARFGVTGHHSAHSKTQGIHLGKTAGLNK
jgi:hypothetical protein